ncbi:MAG: SusD/RagB family nutrient-binding outer membrane lipoprotein [Prevotellaceae bacterium]|jgi:hypothetical protein|nr:SusD/RagB family nutrient-binding outer membrane lipoprotein [Prevotellaceae bacterium]
MKRKNIFSIGLLTAALGISSMSCSDYLDINTNPNYMAEASLPNLLPSIEAGTMAYWALSGMQVGELWMQVATQGNTTNQYNTTVAYNLNTTSYATFWNAYSIQLEDIKMLLPEAEAQGAWNYWLIAKVLQAYNFHLLTDWYEDIPFTEALNAEYPNPKYDSSKTVVYPGIITLLDEAIAKENDAKNIANATLTISNQDYFFGGDISKWVAFAKSLKLKVLMRDFAANQAAIQSLLNAGGLLEEDCKFTAFTDATDKGNPLYEYNIRQLNTTENIRACQTMVEYLLAYGDPRIADFYEITTAAQRRITAGEVLTDREKYAGISAGARPSSDTNGDNPIPLVNSSKYKQAYDDPFYLMNDAEVFFQVAEAWARLGDKAKAKAAYDQGVTNAFARWNRDASSFIGEGGAYAFDDTSLDSMLKCILLQKWISYAKANAWDSVTDRNRTGYPKLTTIEYVRVSNMGPDYSLTEGYELGTLVTPETSALGAGEFPRRLLTPTASSDYNPNAPEPKALTAPMWWQVPAGQ